MIDADETGRHKKRTASDVSKIKNKSKHKHQYADVLISVGPSNSLYIGEICPICGKIKDLKLATGRIEINEKNIQPNAYRRRDQRKIQRTKRVSY